MASHSHSPCLLYYVVVNSTLTLNLQFLPSYNALFVQMHTIHIEGYKSMKEKMRTLIDRYPSTHLCHRLNCRSISTASSLLLLVLAAKYNHTQSPHLRQPTKLCIK